MQQHLVCFDCTLLARGFSQSFISALLDTFIKIEGIHPSEALRLFFITRFFRKVINNRIRIHTTRNHVSGIGIYPLVSLVNHSCHPNACFVFAGNELMLRALEPIPAGAEITVSYVDCRRVAPVRHAHLLKNYDFLCRCDVCSVGNGFESDRQGVDTAAWENDRLRMGIKCTKRCAGVMLPSVVSLDAMPSGDDGER